MSLPENGWFSSFALLTPTTLMVTSTANVSPVMPTEPRSIAAVFPPVIQIYSFAPDPDWSVNPVQPLDSDFMDDTTTRPVLLAQLELPRFAPGVITGSFDVRPDPAYPPNRTPAGTRKPFTQNPEKGVLVFELLVIDPAEAPIGPQEEIGTKAYELFALRETLVDLAREGEDRLVSLRKGGSEQGHALWRVEKTFSWAEWGEQGARMLPIAMRQRNWVCLLRNDSQLGLLLI
jgi:hypothetical protein